MMRSFLVAFFVAASLAGCGIYQLVGRANAQAAAETTAALTADAGPPVAAVAPPTVRDPVSDPAGAFDDLRAARKIGWPVAMLVGLTMVLLAAGHLGVSWLRAGSRAFVLAALTTGCLAAGNAALAGGTWVAIATAGVVAAAGLYQADQTKRAAEKAAAKVGTSTGGGPF